MFEYATTIRLHDTDAAGVLFFANLLKIAHDAYETFLESAGLSIGAALQQGKLIIPIVHAEADFKLPLHTGDKVTVTVKPAEIGTHSYVLDYGFALQNGQCACTAKTVHVVVEKQSGQPLQIPQKLRQALKRIR